jgi:hypothetical protein
MPSVNLRFISPLVAFLALSGCVGVPWPHPGGSDAQAVQILRQAEIAHGSSALETIHDVNVRLEGKWDWLVTRVQPVLVDDRFRGTSEERYLVHDTAAGQAYTGVGGVKQVYRDHSTTRVWYNGRENNDPLVRDAAALVADNYRMFLLGPWFFRERIKTVQYLGVETVDGRDCDNLLAALQPGLGNSSEDRVVISIDNKCHWVRRLRITVDGLESTRGAVADIYLRDQMKVNGAIWPTTFYEELKRPFAASVHHWRLVAIDFDRRFDRTSLEGSTFSGAAILPAGSPHHSGRARGSDGDSSSRENAGNVMRR